MAIGIYKLSFKGTDKVYIGQSENIDKRLSEHLYRFRSGRASRKLQDAYNEFGIPSIEILTECSYEELDLYEKEAINIYNSYVNGFNATEGGSSGRGLSGCEAGGSTYTRDQVLLVFEALILGTHTLKHISESTGVGLGCVSSISRGASHKWLAKEFPDKYKVLLTLKGNRHSKREYLLKNLKTGKEVLLRNVSEFSRNNGMCLKEGNIVLKNILKFGISDNTWQLVGT